MFPVASPMSPPPALPANLAGVGYSYDLFYIGRICCNPPLRRMIVHCSSFPDVELKKTSDAFSSLLFCGGGKRGEGRGELRRCPTFSSLRRDGIVPRQDSARQLPRCLEVIQGRARHDAGAAGRGQRTVSTFAPELSTARVASLAQDGVDAPGTATIHLPTQTGISERAIIDFHSQAASLCVALCLKPWTARRRAYNMLPDFRPHMRKTGNSDKSHPCN